ncbi:hypothetical protein [Gimesia aquarii]|uniref:Uncharacterized protein n=1 Tax=Gimesia aquarii TaxID=2527964 RepID=A0A517WSB6_9PLAN|nr:hypothetical protein [Gimesia aquarii]QDU08151.1 hypothetical protein V202x_15150 [Gimesia aquarii]
MPNSNPACQPPSDVNCDPADEPILSKLFPSITLYGNIEGSSGYYGDEITLNHQIGEWFALPDGSWWSISCQQGVWRLHWDGTISGGGFIDATGGTFPSLIFPGFSTS